MWYARKRKKMTKYREGERHRCDDTCKINHTTDYARENKLSSGSKIISTVESSVRAYKARLDRISKTESFKAKFTESGKRKEPKPLKREIDDRISIPLAKLVTISENSKHIGQMATEIEKALIKVKQLEKDLAD